MGSSVYLPEILPDDCHIVTVNLVDNKNQYVDSKRYPIVHCLLVRYEWELQQKDYRCSEIEFKRGFKSCQLIVGTQTILPVEVASFIVICLFYFWDFD